jgi:hypothetical protein
MLAQMTPSAPVSAVVLTLVESLDIPDLIGRSSVKDGGAGAVPGGAAGSGVCGATIRSATERLGGALLGNIFIRTLV